MTSLNGRPPRGLGEFAETDVLEIVVEAHGQIVEIHGSARRDGSRVLVNEKYGDGTGNNVRIWTIELMGDRFVATQR